VVLDRDTIPCNVVAVDNHPVLGRVSAVVHETGHVVVSPPQPRVVHHHVASVDGEHHVSLYFRSWSWGVRTCDSEYVQTAHAFVNVMPLLSEHR
jgi:hypothetical protein